MEIETEYLKTTTRPKAIYNEPCAVDAKVIGAPTASKYTCRKVKNYNSNT
jgi:hypothetical protein